MPSIARLDVGAVRREVVRHYVDPADDATQALRVVAASDVEALVGTAEQADAVCVVFGDEPQAGLAAVRRLREAAPELAIVVLAGPTSDSVLAPAAAGAHEPLDEGADPRLVALALRRAAAETADHRELRRLRAQLSRGAEGGALELLSGPLGDVRSVPRLCELERDAIRRALVATGGRVGQAAKLLGIGRATLYRRLATFDLVRKP